MRTPLVCVMFAVLAVPLNVAAQSLPLTEQDALARLSPDSPRLRAIRAPIDIARAEELSVARWPNPRAMYDRESVAGNTEHIATVGQSLPISGRRGFEKQAAGTLVEAGTDRSNDAERRLRTDLQLAFAQLVAAQTRERELLASRNRLAALADILAKREAAGDASGFDRLRAEHEVVDIDADRAGAATDRARAQAMLASYFDAPVDPSQIVAVEREALALAPPNVDALIERANSNRGDLLALRKEIDAARLSARAAQRRAVPEPEVVAGTKSSSVNGGSVGGVLTIQAVIPLFDRGRPEHALAVARAGQAEARLAAFQQSLRSEIAALRATVLERRDTAGRYRAAAVAGALRLEQIAQISYDAGERGILELLDAQRLGSSARIRQVNLDLAVRQAELELAFVSGWEVTE